MRQTNQPVFVHQSMLTWTYQSHPLPLCDQAGNHEDLILKSLRSFLCAAAVHCCDRHRTAAGLCKCTCMTRIGKNIRPISDFAWDMFSPLHADIYQSKTFEPTYVSICCGWASYNLWNARKKLPRNILFYFSPYDFRFSPRTTQSRQGSITVLSANNSTQIKSVL